MSRAPVNYARQEFFKAAGMMLAASTLAVSIFAGGATAYNSIQAGLSVPDAFRVAVTSPGKLNCAEMTGAQSPLSDVGRAIFSQRCPS